MEDLEPIKPGEIFKEEFLEPMGITQSELARALKVRPNRISQIISGKREISVDTALRLGRFYNVSPEFWLNLQQRYSLKIAQRMTFEKIANDVPVFG